MRIGQGITIRQHPTWDGTVLDVMPPGQYFEHVTAVLVLVKVPGCNPTEMLFKGHELKDSLSAFSRQHFPAVPAPR